MRILSNGLNLWEHRERGFKNFLGQFSDSQKRPWLLFSKLVTWESQYVEFIFEIAVLINPSQFTVMLIGVPTCTSYIYDKSWLKYK